jgi:glyoxylase-like metal-dependent hydrolase (beta-lactamase superfamily II)
MKIIPLSEGSFTIDQTKEFVPFNLDTDDLQARSRGSLLVEIQPFLVITKNDILLLDTGLGFRDETGVLQLHNNLSLHGIYPSDITKVLMSHLHKDHAGGMVMLDQLRNEYQLSFPNATYYIHKKEMDFALKGQNPSYNLEKLGCLLNSEQVSFLHEDQGSIDDNIHYELSSGHSPFHQVFTIKQDNEIVFYGGDEAPQLQQMKTKFIAKYDADGKRAMELRQRWMEIGKEEGWMFLFYHDIISPVMKF